MGINLAFLLLDVEFQKMYSVSVSSSYSTFIYLFVYFSMGGKYFLVFDVTVKYVCVILNFLEGSSLFTFKTPSLDFIPSLHS